MIHVASRNLWCRVLLLLQSLKDRLILRGDRLVGRGGLLEWLLGQLRVFGLGLRRRARGFPCRLARPAARPLSLRLDGVGVQLDRKRTSLGVIERVGIPVQLRIGARARLLAWLIVRRSQLRLQLLQLPGDFLEQLLDLRLRPLSCSRLAAALSGLLDVGSARLGTRLTVSFSLRRAGGIAPLITLLPCRLGAIGRLLRVASGRLLLSVMRRRSVRLLSAIVLFVLVACLLFRAAAFWRSPNRGGTCRLLSAVWLLLVAAAALWPALLRAAC